MANKNLEQKIASTQNKLNELKSKQNAISRKERDRERYALGGDVVKYFNYKEDRELLIGLLSCPFNEQVREQIRKVGRTAIEKSKTK